MNRVNWFYISLLLIGIGLILYFAPKKETEIAFFGFAENLETEINYNYPVMVDQIFVTPGVAVDQNTLLIKLLRKTAKEELDKQSYRIETVRSELNAWIQKQESQKIDMELSYAEDLAQLDGKIEILNQEINSAKQLHSKLFDEEYQPTAEQSSKLKQLIDEKLKLEEDFKKRIDAHDKESQAGKMPFLSEINELTAEEAFEKEHKIIEIQVNAPQSGLIGNINCREGEHIPAFKTLMTIYEPHSALVKGYVHEESILEIGEDAEFEVSSLLKPELTYKGKLIGMGSRIVEIPVRLRKFPQIKTYGREITIEIPADNIFLQKEKVSVKLLKNK
jgi:multidrug resistance efflux pump